MLGDAKLYALEVVHRSETTADQVRRNADLLLADAGARCSPQQLALMRALDLGSSYIQAIGQVVDQRLVCSSQDAQAGVDLGPPAVRSPSGALLRPEVRLPLGHVSLG